MLKRASTLSYDTCTHAPCVATPACHCQHRRVETSPAYLRARASIVTSSYAIVIHCLLCLEHGDAFPRLRLRTPFPRLPGHLLLQRNAMAFMCIEESIGAVARAKERLWVTMGTTKHRQGQRPSPQEEQAPRYDQDCYVEYVRKRATHS
jgi:hypothetical protein